MGVAWFLVGGCLPFVLQPKRGSRRGDNPLCSSEHFLFPGHAEQCHRVTHPPTTGHGDTGNATKTHWSQAQLWRCSPRSQYVTFSSFLSRSFCRVSALHTVCHCILISNYVLREKEKSHLELGVLDAQWEGGCWYTCLTLSCLWRDTGWDWNWDPGDEGGGTLDPMIP